MVQLLKTCAIFGLIWTQVFAQGDEICLLPLDPGKCPEQNSTSIPIPRFFYHAKTLRCIGIPHSGCGGNQNNFATLQECNAKCGHLASKGFEEMRLGIRKAGAKECWFDGKIYKSWENLPAEDPSDPCSDNSCSCSDGWHTCDADGGCPSAKYDPSCTWIRQPNKCCETECVPEAEVQKMFKCKYDGKEIVEHGIFTPKDFPCLKCTCTRNFTGTLSMADCKIEHCYSLSGDSFNQKMKDGCNPFYEKETDCCPDFATFWKC